MSEYKWVDPYERSFREGSERMAREYAAFRRMNEQAPVTEVAGVPFRRTYPVAGGNVDYWKADLPGVELTVRSEGDKWTWTYKDGDQTHSHNRHCDTREQVMRACRDLVVRLADKALTERRREVQVLERSLTAMRSAPQAESRPAPVHVPAPPPRAPSISERVEQVVARSAHAKQPVSGPGALTLGQLDVLDREGVDLAGGEFQVSVKSWDMPERELAGHPSSVSAFGLSEALCLASQRLPGGQDRFWVRALVGGRSHEVPRELWERYLPGRQPV